MSDILPSKERVCFVCCKEPCICRKEHPSSEARMTNQSIGCDYQGREFGAHYLDSVCIEGYLWDADSGDAGDDGWVYTNGGDLPCPQCNHDEYREYHADSVIEDAYIAVSDGKWPFAKPRWKQDRLWMWRLQLQGVFSFLWDKTRGRA